MSDEHSRAFLASKPVSYWLNQHREAHKLSQRLGNAHAQIAHGCTLFPPPPDGPARAELLDCVECEVFGAAEDNTRQMMIRYAELEALQKLAEDI